MLNKTQNSPQKTGRKINRLAQNIIDLKKQLDCDDKDQAALSGVPEVPYNKKVDEIMHKKPLRERL